MIIVLFSIWTNVNLLLPHPVHTASDNKLLNLITTEGKNNWTYYSTQLEIISERKIL